MEMVNIVGRTGAKACLRRISKIGGLQVADELKRTYGWSTTEDILHGAGEVVKAAWLLFGYGLAEFIPEPQMTFRIWNNYESVGANFNEPFCFITEGYLEGVAEGLFGRKAQCREVSAWLRETNTASSK